MTNTKTSHVRRKKPAHATANDDTQETAMNDERTTQSASIHASDQETSMPSTTISSHPSIQTASPTSTSSSIASSTAARTGATNSLASLVAALSAALDEAESQMGPEAPSTTTRDKRRRAKPRKGSDKVLLQLAPAIQQYGLDSTSLSSKKMIASYEKAQTLVPLQTRLQKMSKRVDDEVFDAQTDAWDMGLQFYSLLQRRAKNNGSVAKTIEPLTKAFAFRSEEVKKKQPSKVSTRVKARLKETIALAERHGVSVTVGANGEPTSVTGSPAAVAAMQAQVAAINAGAGVAPVAPAAPASTPSPVSSGAAPTVTAPLAHS